MSGPGTSPYTSVTISGYNSSPPVDDGSETEANRVKWSTIKTKITDPVKTGAEDINTALVAAFAKVPNTDDGVKTDYAGNIGFESDELTLSSAGAITPNRTHHTVDTYEDAASDTLSNIVTTNMATDAILILRAASTDRTVILGHADTGAGQLHLAYDTDVSLDDDFKTVILQRRGTDWYEIARNFTGPGDMAELSTIDKTNDKLMAMDATDGQMKWLAIKDAGGVTSGTKQATTTGTAFDFTGIPAGTKQIDVMWNGCSLSGTDVFIVQLGDAGGIETSGYVSSSTDSGAASTSTSGFVIRTTGGAGATSSGMMSLRLLDAATFAWTESHGGFESGNIGVAGGGGKSLSAELTQVRFTRSGTDTFDAGAVNILYVV